MLKCLLRSSGSEQYGEELILNVNVLVVRVLGRAIERGTDSECFFLSC